MTLSFIKAHRHVKGEEFTQIKEAAKTRWDKMIYTLLKPSETDNKKSSDKDYKTQLDLLKYANLFDFKKPTVHHTNIHLKKGEHIMTNPQQNCHLTS